MLRAEGAPTSTKRILLKSTLASVGKRPYAPVLPTLHRKPVPPLDAAHDLPPISFAPKSPAQEDPVIFTFSFGRSRKRLHLRDHVPDSPATPKLPLSTTHVPVSPPSTCETRVERSIDSTDDISPSVSDGDVLARYRAAQLKPSRVPSTRPSDPNANKRREWIHYLKQQQKSSLDPPHERESSAVHQRFLPLIDFCNKNNFFDLRITPTELVLNATSFPAPVLVFHPQDENFENWGFPKPSQRDSDADVFDSQFYQKMHQSPSVETFMQELFRIVCSRAITFA